MIKTVVEIQIKSEKKIQDKFSSIRAFKSQLRQFRSQIRDTFNQDKEYHDLDIQVKDVKLKLKNRKDKIEENTPAIGTLRDKIDTLKENLKSEQLTLSDWLVDYNKKTTNTTIPDDMGNIVGIEIKTTAKIKKEI
jgi:predicted  nucleic acid-binding Zn-ribbon protein